MSEVITFLFNEMNLLWQLIISQWILSMPILIVVIGMIIQLINQSYNKK